MAHPGADGIVRVVKAKVKLSTGKMYTRPSVKLCLLSQNDWRLSLQGGWYVCMSANDKTLLASSPIPRNLEITNRSTSGLCVRVEVRLGFPSFLLSFFVYFFPPFYPSSTVTITIVHHACKTITVTGTLRLLTSMQHCRRHHHHSFLNFIIIYSFLLCIIHY